MSFLLAYWCVGLAIVTAGSILDPEGVRDAEAFVCASEDMPRGKWLLWTVVFVFAALIWPLMVLDWLDE